MYVGGHNLSAFAVGQLYTGVSSINNMENCAGLEITTEMPCCHPLARNLSWGRSGVIFLLCMLIFVCSPITNVL